MKFNVKDFLKFDVTHGKKLVTVAYYATLIVAAVAALVAIIDGFIGCFAAYASALSILRNIWQILTAPFIFAFRAILIRLVGEFFCNIIDIKEK